VMRKSHRSGAAAQRKVLSCSGARIPRSLIRTGNAPAALDCIFSDDQNFGLIFEVKDKVRVWGGRQQVNRIEIGCSRLEVVVGVGSVVARCLPTGPTHAISVAGSVEKP
jgi:hypothetical protein